MYELKDKVVLVTGAAKGIGANIVREVLEKGAKHVTILDVDEKSGVLLQDELNQKFCENKVKFVKCDVSNEQQFYKALDDAKEDNGYIDILINNAGVGDESNLPLIRKQIEINFIAVVNGTLKAMELMHKDKGGRGGAVINISSTGGLTQVPSLFVYSSTKRAVLHFSTCVGQLPCSNTGVRVMAICLGVTDTPLLGNLKSFNNTFDKVLLQTLKRRPMQSIESAVRGIIEVFEKGESASAWLVQNGDPALDITQNLLKADADIAREIKRI